MFCTCVELDGREISCGYNRCWPGPLMSFATLLPSAYSPIAYYHHYYYYMPSTPLPFPPHPTHTAYPSST